MFRHRLPDFDLNRTSPQARGLVFWAPLLNNSALDFISGKVGTRTGALARTTSARGQVFDFTASPILYWTPTYKAYPLTMMGWFNPDNVTNLLIGVSLGDTATANGYTLAAQGDVAGDPVRAFSDGGGSYWYAGTSTSYSATTWQHMAGVWTANNDRAVYLNGGGKGSNGASISTNQASINRLAIAGSYLSSPTYQFDGKLMDVRVYRRALSDSEIAAYYRNPWDLFTPLQRWWLPVFAGAAPIAATDLAGTAASATQANLTWLNPNITDVSFEVERSTDNVTWALIATTAVNATSYNDTGLTEATLYYYRVRAANADGTSPYTSVISVLNYPDAPSALTATPVSETEIALSWVDNSNLSASQITFTNQSLPSGGATIVSYLWQYSADSGVTWTTFSTAPNPVWVTALTSYQVKLTVTDSAGQVASKTV